MDNHKIKVETELMFELVKHKGFLWNRRPVYGVWRLAMQLNGPDIWRYLSTIEGISIPNIIKNLETYNYFGRKNVSLNEVLFETNLG